MFQSVSVAAVSGQCDSSNLNSEVQKCLFRSPVFSGGLSSTGQIQTFCRYTAVVLPPVGRSVQYRPNTDILQVYSCRTAASRSVCPYNTKYRHFAGIQLSYCRQSLCLSIQYQIQTFCRYTAVVLPPVGRSVHTIPNTDILQVYSCRTAASRSVCPYNTKYRHFAGIQLSYCRQSVGLSIQYQIQTFCRYTAVVLPPVALSVHTIPRTVS